MKVLLTIILSLVFSSLSQATELKEPKYSDIKKMSFLEVDQALSEYIGTSDTWRKQNPVLGKIKSIIPFKRKLTLSENAKNLSLAFTKNTPNNLRQYVLATQRSPFSEIRSTVTSIQGDKRMAMEAWNQFKGNTGPKPMLYFFRTLDYGDTGLETKKFFEFVYGFNLLARKIESAANATEELKIPLVLEFESNALIPQSPLTKLFFNTLVAHHERLLKVEVTPNNGRLVAIHPYYAKVISDNVSLFAQEFSKRVRFDRSKLTSDRSIRKGLADLLRTGEGMSGLFYTNEKIVEIVLDDAPNLTCANLFK